MPLSGITHWYNSGYSKPERASLCTGNDRGFDERVVGEKIKLVGGGVTIKHTMPTKKSYFTALYLVQRTMHNW